MWFFISDPNFALIGQYGAEILQKRTIFNMASVRHLKFAKFRFLLSNVHPQNRNSHQFTKFDWNRLMHGWDMEMMLFSKWRTSAILNFLKLPFWLRDLYLHVILHLLSEYRINRPIRRHDIAKNDFQYGICLPSWICYDVCFYCLSHSTHCVLSEVY